MSVARYLVGEDVDIETAERLRADLDPLVSDVHVDPLVLDCRGLAVIDSSGVHLLLDVRQTLVDQGRRLRVTNLSPAMRRVFDLMGLSAMLRVSRA
jgi:anti-anti-sigma factor